MTGFIVVNKLEGVSSAREVAIIKRLTGMPCGHMGTLDPMASGVLPIAVGNATRLFDFFLNKTKTYVATFRFGEDYDTLDTTGTLLKSGERIPSPEEIDAVIPKLVGEIMQVPPKYSAKNVNGQRGYKLAREGVEFTLPPKKVSIYSIKRLSYDGDSSFSFEIVCGGGTYIRSIARDMAKELGTVATMSRLVRTSSGPFIIEKSVATNELNKDNLKDYFIPCDSVTPFEDIRLNERDAKKLFNGIAIRYSLADGTYRLYAPDGSFYGLGCITEGILKVRVKLC